MQAPRFWFTPPDAPAWPARALAPLAALTARATARRVARAPDHAPGIPVICVGNVNAGGTGKTPAAIALVQRLQERGLTPHVLSRGYGGTLDGPVQVRSLVLVIWWITGWGPGMWECKGASKCGDFGILV